MAGSADVLDIQAIIDEFTADPLLLSTQLPHMTTGQRKNAKKILEQYPELSCESFGFGQERKLHLFKTTPVQAPATATTQSKSFDDDIPTEAGEMPVEPCASEAPCSSDAAALKNLVQCIMDGQVSKLDFASIREAAARGNGWGHPTDASTVAPSSCTSDCSPASTFRGMPPWFRLPPGLELEVQNTFIHYKHPPLDPRAVRSMPHCMFQKCLLVEALGISEKAAHTAVGLATTAPVAELGEENCSLAAGTEVVIEGLSKFPAFNGLRGTLQLRDEQDGRYNILLATPVRGHKTVKVKPENFKLLSAKESLNVSSDYDYAPRPLKLTGLV